MQQAHPPSPSRKHTHVRAHPHHFCPIVTQSDAPLACVHLLSLTSTRLHQTTTGPFTCVRPHCSHTHLHSTANSSRLRPPLSACHPYLSHPPSPPLFLGTLVLDGCPRRVHPLPHLHASPPARLPPFVHVHAHARRPPPLCLSPPSYARPPSHRIRSCLVHGHARADVHVQARPPPSLVCMPPLSLHPPLPLHVGHRHCVRSPSCTCPRWTAILLLAHGPPIASVPSCPHAATLLFIRGPAPVLCACHPHCHMHPSQLRPCCVRPPLYIKLSI